MKINMKIKYLSILPIIAVLAFSGVSLAHADVFTDNLYYGLQNNSQVSQLQEFLTSQGLYSGPITGNFYFLTLGAVKAFQTQQGITPAAGYFGQITMAAANKVADAAVSASNNEAISETGTSTPSVSSASSTLQLQLAALLQEVALLQQELAAQQSSSQQQSQTLQQIAQNTTPSIVTVPTATQPRTSTPVPTASITVNGSANAINIPYNTATTISWNSTNANSCNVSPMGWSGISSNQNTGNLTASQTYTLSCSGAGGSTSASVTVNVAAAPQLAKINVVLGGNQVLTGVAHDFELELFDQYGNPITSSATITIDQNVFNLPNASVDYICGGARCSQGVSGATIFYYYYPLTYTSQTDGQHTINVLALGSTQSIVIISTAPPPPELITASQNGNLGTQNVSQGATNVEIGSYVLTMTTLVEGANVNTVSITANQNGTFSPANLSNLKLVINGVQFGSIQPKVNVGTYTFSGMSFPIRAGGAVNVDIYADISSSASGSSSGGATSLTGVSADGQVAYDSIPLSSSAAGQDLTVSSSTAQ